VRLKHFVRICLPAALIFSFSSACALTNVLSERLAPQPMDIPPPARITEEIMPAPPQPIVPVPEQTAEIPDAFFSPGERVEFPADALDQLDSYRSVLRLVSSQGGPETSQRLEILDERIRAQDAVHLRIAGDGIGSSEQGEIAFYRFGALAFTYVPNEADNTCLVFDRAGNEAAFAGALVPHELFTSLEIDALIAVDDEIEGVNAQRYTVRSAELTLGAGETTLSEIWFAQEGGYVVRFNGETRGVFALSETETESTLHWDYRLTMINDLAEISLPDACREQQRTAEFPIPNNAVNRTIYNSFISFESPDTPQAVALFYRERLPLEGWSISSLENVGEFYQIQAVKDDRSVQITIHAGEVGAAVVVVKD